jgi:hypothetical protein
MRAEAGIARWSLAAIIVFGAPISTAGAVQPEPAIAPASATATTGAVHDGSHDFDFPIGDWKAPVRVLRDRLNRSNDRVVYEGTSKHKKLLDSNANFEDFDAFSTQLNKRNKGQTLRLYNPETRQWSINLLDVDQGTPGLPPVTGEFAGKSGEFYNQDTYKGAGNLRAPCVA